VTNGHQGRDDFEATASLLLKVPGGSELLDWMNGVPNFGDAEIISLVLDRTSQSRLCLRLQRFDKSAEITFALNAWIDVAIRGFSQQNVVGGLKLRPAGERKIELWEYGVGCTPGELEIELEPCFGAYGTVRANLASIAITPLPTPLSDFTR
jgi:hypothetical protein